MLLHTRPRLYFTGTCRPLIYCFVSREEKYHWRHYFEALWYFSLIRFVSHIEAFMAADTHLIYFSFVYFDIYMIYILEEIYFLCVPPHFTVTGHKSFRLLPLHHRRHVSHFMSASQQRCLRSLLLQKMAKILLRLADTTLCKQVRNYGEIFFYFLFIANDTITSLSASTALLSHTHFSPI